MLEGRLGDFTLPDILRLLAFTAKSGRLWVSDQRVSARVDMLEGRIRDASGDTSTLGLARRLLGQELVDADALNRVLEPYEAMPTDVELARALVEADVLEAGVLADLAREQVVDALFGLLRWTEGAFRFEAQAGEHRGPSVLDLALTVDDALDEVGRRLEAHAAVEERTGEPDAVVTIRRPGRERAEVGLAPDGWTLLALVDGHRTVADLVRLSGQGDYRTRRTLAALLDEGIVAVGDAAELPPAERLVQAQRTVAGHEARLAGDAVPAGTASPEPSGAADPVPAADPGPTADPVPTEAAAPPATEEPGAEPEPAEAPAPTAAASTAADAVAAAAPGAAAAPPAPSTPPGVTPLRAKARRPQLRTDPEVDEELLHRLIDGVESL